MSKLLLADLRDKNKPVKFEFDLRGTAEEPLAEEHRVVRCSARERVEQVFLLRNASGKGESADVMFWDSWESGRALTLGMPKVFLRGRGVVMTGTRLARAPPRKM